jgi:hypothetical protein
MGPRGAEEQKDAERTEAKAVSEKKKTAHVAVVAVAAALKDTVEVRGGEEEGGGKQGAAERKEAEGAGASQEIQVLGLFQEKDDDDGLPDESPAKRKSKSKNKKAGDQGASASKTAPWATEANEAGAAAASVGVEAKAWSPPLQADVEQAADLMSGAAATSEERHCLWPSSTSRRRIHHQEKPRPLVPPLLWGQQQCQKKHQQKACRELRRQGQGSVSRISPFQKRPTTSRSGS